MPELTWVGKDKVLTQHLDVPYRVLEHQYSYDEDGAHDEDRGTGNMIIHGDNLEALKALLPRYEGKVDCIYIDPPYNTGNEGWVYNDAVNDPRIAKWLGDVVGKEGEDLSRHDKWLCMMYPRLRLLHRLLAPHGVIAASIDDDEMPAMRLMLDEIFGRRNFYAQVVWQKKYSPANDAKRFSDMHDYVVFYSRSDAFVRNLAPRTEANNKPYRHDDGDGRGRYRSDNLSVRTYSAACDYPVTNPNTGKVYNPPKGTCWRVSQSKMAELISDNRIYWGAKGDKGPSLKRYLSETKQGVVPVTWWPHEFAGHNDAARKEIRALFGTVGSFDTPKPTRLLERVLQVCTRKNSVVLDSYAGSGTTAHAVLNLNKIDGGGRRFILVELGDYADTVTAERVKRVIDGYGEGRNAVAGTGGAFSYYELGDRLLIDGNLNPHVDPKRVREFIWYTETHTPLPARGDTKAPYFLGVANRTGYHLIYDPQQATTLDHAYVAVLDRDLDGHVIYADMCTLTPEELTSRDVVFKKIPRDITRL